MSRELVRKMYVEMRKYHTGALVLIGGDPAVDNVDLRDFEGLARAYDPTVPAGSLYVITEDDWRERCGGNCGA